MASSVVQFIFEAVNRTSDTLNKINSDLNKLQGSTQKSNDLIKGAFQGAGMAAFNTVVQTLTGSFNALGDAINQGAQRQTSLLASAGGLGVAMGKDVQSSAMFLREFNAELTKSVAALPGATRSYLELANGIIDDLVPAFQGLNGEVDTDALKKMTTSIAESYGVIGAAQNVGSVGTTQALQGLLSGRSTSELKKLEFFQQGIGNRMLKSIQDELANAGIEDMKDATVEMRAKILQKVGERYVTDDLKNMLSDTYEGVMESMKTEFDKMTDFDRLLSGRNNMSVMDALKDVLTSMFDFFNKIGATLSSIFGMNQDTLLVTLFDGLKGLAAYIDGISKSIDPAAIKKIFDGIVNFFNSLMSTDVVSLTGSDQMAALLEGGWNFGEKIGQAIRDWANSVDWGQVLVDLGKITLAAGEMTLGFVGGFTNQLLILGGEMLLSVIEILVSGFNGIVISFGEAIAGWVESATAAVTDFGSQILAKINELWNSLSSAVSNAIESAKSSILSFDFGSLVNQAKNAALQAVTGQPVASPVSYNRNTSTSNYSNPVFNVSVSGSADSVGTAYNIADVLDRQWKSYKSGYVGA